MVGQHFHRAGRTRHLAGLQIREHLLRQCVDKANVSVRIRGPGLTHDPFHGLMDAFGGGSAIVDSEFHKQQIRIVLQRITLKTKHTEA